MRISYRQGLLSSQSDWLQISQLDASYIDIIVSPTPVIAAVAAGAKDYLIAEQRSVTHAWGPFAANQTYYLFWEINPRSGSVTRAATTLSQVSGATAPALPGIGQMWWDSNAKETKVWTGAKWNSVLRVFAGTLESGGILTPEPYESQVGINTPTDAGFILKDAGGNPYRTNEGGLLTTDTPLTSLDTGSLVKLEGAQILAQANENIPKFSVVYLADGRAALASSLAPYHEAKAPIGMVTVDAAQNDVVTIVVAGREVYNDQWSWAVADLGKPVYCTSAGVVTLTKPLAPKKIRVGTIISATSILLDFDWETDIVLAAGVYESTNVLAEAPIFVTGTLSVPIVNITQASDTTDGYIRAADMARITVIETILPSKSNVGHQHPISDVTGLQTVLNNKSDVGHTHTISQVTGLQTALNAKSDVGHTHTIAEVTGLQTALDAKISFNNSTAYTPIGDYNPASKKYVDDRPLVELSDVDITSPSIGQVISWNGTKWVTSTLPAQTVPALVTLTDVDITAPVVGQVISWNGTKWVTSTLPEQTVPALTGLTDVSITTPATGDAVVWNGTAWISAAMSTTLADLTDTDVTVINDGDTLYWDASIGKWLPGAPAVGGGPATTVYHDLVEVQPYPFGLPGNLRGMRAVDHIFTYICVADETDGETPIWRRTALETWGSDSYAADITGMLRVDYGMVSDATTSYLEYDPEYLFNPYSLTDYNNNIFGAKPIKAAVDYGTLLPPPPIVIIN